MDTKCAKGLPDDNGDTGCGLQRANVGMSGTKGRPPRVADGGAVAELHVASEEEQQVTVRGISMWTDVLFMPKAVCLTNPICLTNHPRKRPCTRVTSQKRNIELKSCISIPLNIVSCDKSESVFNMGFWNELKDILFNTGTDGMYVWVGQRRADRTWTGCARRFPAFVRRIL